jgi:hypothetical protein
MPRLRHLLPGFIIAIAAFLILTPAAWAFCGFYVAKADTSLYNQASQVAIARDGDRTILTMANDYQGEVEDFALVVPVPTVITEGQVNVADATIMERLDAFSAPRLVEYFDADPCAPIPSPRPLPSAVTESRAQGGSAGDRAAALGVTVEAQYTVGEYDILILSAEESDGLETWLRQNDYHCLIRPVSCCNPISARDEVFCGAG